MQKCSCASNVLQTSRKIESCEKNCLDKSVVMNSFWSSLKNNNNNPKDSK